MEVSAVDEEGPAVWDAAQDGSDGGSEGSQAAAACTRKPSYTTTVPLRPQDAAAQTLGEAEAEAAAAAAAGWTVGDASADTLREEDDERGKGISHAIIQDLEKSGMKEAGNKVRTQWGGGEGAGGAGVPARSRAACGSASASESALPKFKDLHSFFLSSSRRTSV